METLAVAAPKHKAACEFVYYDDLAFLDHIVNIPFHNAVGPYGLIDMVGKGGVFKVCKVFQSEMLLRLGYASGGKGGVPRLFVNDIVGIEVLILFRLLVNAGNHKLLQPADKIVHLLIELGALVTLTGNDEGGAGLVYQNGVYLVNNGEVMPALNHIALVDGHIVAEIIKAHLVVGAVSNIRVVGLSAPVGGETVDNETNLQSEEAVDLAHPLAVAAGKIVVDGDDVDTLALKSVQVGGQNGNKGLAFAGLHFRNASLMENDAAYKLNAERLHTQHAPCRLTNNGKCLGENIVKGLACGKAGFELLCLGAKSLIAHCGAAFVQRLYPVNEGIYFFQLSFGVAAKKLIKNSHMSKCLSYMHSYNILLSNQGIVPYTYE